MKRLPSLILPVAAALAFMAPVAAFAQFPTPTPSPKFKKPAPGGPVGNPQFTHTPPPVVHTPPPVVTHTPPPTVNTHKFTAVPTATPKGTPLYHKSLVGGVTPAPTTGNTGNPPSGTPKFKKGTAGFQKPNPSNPAVSAPVVNTQIINKNIKFKQTKSWAGPKVVAGGGGGGGAHQFTQANNYGNHWVAFDAHSDWGRGQEHDFDGHHWRWFNGGWLNIDDGFWPEGYYNPYTGPSKIYDAQAELANMGYYNGTVDGVPGPMTRQAIADFQSDNGLPVDGHLNPPTQDALGLDQQD